MLQSAETCSAQTRTDGAGPCEEALLLDSVVRVNRESCVAIAHRRLPRLRRATRLRNREQRAKTQPEFHFLFWEKWCTTPIYWGFATTHLWNECVSRLEKPYSCPRGGALVRYKGNVFQTHPGACHEIARTQCPCAVRKLRPSPLLCYHHAHAAARLPSPARRPCRPQLPRKYPNQEAHAHHAPIHDLLASPLRLSDAL
jgi:hypothetical protein